MNFLRFHKYSGTGNDFIIIDNLQQKWNPENLPLKHLCHRQNGIGADGIIFVEKSSYADAKMRIFNSDGSEADMCGNGLRCVIDFLHSHFSKDNFYVESKYHKHRCTWKNSLIQVEMGPPTQIDWNISLNINQETIPLIFMNTGVPHAVIFHENIDKINIDDLGGKIRHHPHFGMKGSNVNFVERIENGIKIRTFERGVEGETLACGTGATASALASRKFYDLPSPINVLLKSGDTLQIDFILSSNNEITNTFMSGKCSKIFEGQISF